MLADGVGVIDADYYDNPNNEGHIAGIFYNYNTEPYRIKRGDRIMQGVVVNYQNLAKASITDADRTGGFGSTGTGKADD